MTATEQLDVPDHWRWREGPVSGPAVVFDIDGVLSDAAGRQHFLEGPRRDWEGFFDACGDDPVLDNVSPLLELLDSRLRIVLLTGRPVRVQDRTVDWLEANDLRWDLLIMRPWGDYSAALAFKKEAIAELRDAGFELRLGFEDDIRNAEMFRAEKVPCVYIHSGYYG